MALEGKFNTPIGAVQKKTAVLLGGCAVVLAVIVYYRQKQLGGSGDVSTEDAPINPATGYPYGSPEDAAALAQQSSYVSPVASGGGGSSIPPSNVGFTSNGEWTQAAITYMTNNNLIEDPSQLSAALGKYVTGAYADDTQAGLIQQAIAAVGYPPLNGINGYPPSINKTPPTTSTPTPSNATKIVGMHVTGSDKSSVTVGWGFDGQKPDYIQIIRNGVPIGQVYGTYTVYKYTGLKSKTKYNFQVVGFKNQTPGTPSAIVQGTTK